MSTDTFNNSDGTGLWFDSANWSGGIPGSDTDAADLTTGTTIGSFYAGEEDAVANSLSLSGSGVFINAWYANHASGVDHLTIENSLDISSAEIDGPGSLVVGGTTSLSGNGSIQTFGFQAQNVVGSGTIEVGSLSIANASSAITLELGTYTTTITASSGSFGGLLTVSLPQPAPVMDPPPPPTYQTVDLSNLAYQAGETVSVTPTAIGSSIYSVILLAPDGQPLYTLAQVEDAAHTPISAMAYASDLPGTTINIACYCFGTRILTDSGERPVEVLEIGNTVITASGQHRLIKWIGRRSYAGRFLAANSNVQPVCFRAGSLGDGLPGRDLLVSPEHSMFLDGLLIPARCLLNGSTIVRERGLERVDYFHIELETHDILLAEGAPSESFMDDDSRGMFHNATEFAVLYPNAPPRGRFCAPKVEGGYELEAIRQRLAEVARAA